MDIPRRRCVLVADDDASIRLLLIAILRRQGYRILEARNGRETLAEMRAGCADLVIMDLVMPELSGWDVLHERAADPALLRIPVIVISASNTVQVSAGVVGKHIYAVIAKPFDLDVLVRTVSACLDHPHVPVLAAA